MARRKVQFARGEYYHIYNRGCNKDKIFLSRENYGFLLRLLRPRMREFHISVIASCLMPNHYHFLLRQDTELSIRDMMQSLFNSYTKSFNAMFDRSGTLFEGPFQAIHVDEENYLIHLCRYIHRNPLDAGLVKSPEAWEFSNYREWIGKRHSGFVDTDFVHARFRVALDYINFVEEYVPPEKVVRSLSKYHLD
jgi:putative transposase